MKQIHLKINARNIIENLSSVIYTANDVLDEIITIACDFDNPDINASEYPYLKWTLHYPKECFITPADITEMPSVIINAFEDQMDALVIQKFLADIDNQTENNYIKMTDNIEADLCKAFNIIEYLNQNYIPENSDVVKKIIVSQNLIDWFLGSSDFNSAIGNRTSKPIIISNIYYAGSYKGIEVFANNFPNSNADEIIICYGDHTKFHYIDDDSRILMKLDGNECIFQAAIQGYFKKEFGGINYFKIKK